MKRWMFKIVICLLLGFVTSIIVAWACAIWGSVSLGSVESQPAKWEDLERLQEAGWNRTSETDDWMYTRSINTWKGIGVSELLFLEKAVQQPDSGLGISGVFRFDFYFACVTQSGWPWRCLSREHLDPSGNGQGMNIWPMPWHPSNSRFPSWGDAIDFRQETPIANWQHSMSFELPEKIGPITLPADRYLPLRPIWSGLIINTIIYAAIIWVMMFIASIMQQHRRFKKGHCPKCNYELRSDYSAGCPECGWGREAEE